VKRLTADEVEAALREMAAEVRRFRDDGDLEAMRRSMLDMVLLQRAYEAQRAAA
jgi:hypothetical protein